MSEFLPFALPDIGEEEIQEVVDSLRSGWVTTGPKVKQFESQFAKYVGGGVEAVAVNSATAGLHLALEAIGVGPRDEVITTPYTFTSTAEVVRYLGGEPVFVDINPATLNIDPEKIEEKITSRTKAIIPVHFAGLPCDMGRIISIAKEYNLRIIEDAAHALPAKYNGSLIGSLDSDATVFSFYATKTITTGEGGMVVTRNKGLAERCRVMRLHGISRDAFDRYVSTKPSWHYEVIAPGYKYNMTDLAAAMGIHQLTKADKFRAVRADIADQYNEAFKDLPVLLPPVADTNVQHAWHLYVLRLLDNSHVSRDRFIEKMADYGIGCSVHFIPLHLHPYWKSRYHYEEQDFPHAYHSYLHAVSLPLYTRMNKRDIARVIHAVRDILDA